MRVASNRTPVLGAPEVERVPVRDLRADKGFRLGTHRTVAPTETLHRVVPVATAIGVTRFADITGLDRLGIPTVLAVRPNGGWLAVDGGKGLTKEHAIVSAAMECIERHHADTVEPPSFSASWSELDAAGLVASIEEQPLARHGLFAPDVHERWTWAWDIVNDRPLAVPACMLGSQPERRVGDDPLNFQVSSNGLSSGNHLVESVCAGLYEVVERDALACWQPFVRSGTGHFPRVDLTSVTSPVITTLIEQIEAADVTPLLFDLTVDTGIPTYLVHLIDRSGGRQYGAYRGLGTHLDPEVAMVRAITEAAQCRVIMIAGSRDDFLWADRREGRQGDDRRRHHRLIEAKAVVPADAHEDATTDSFQGDLDVILDRLARAGLHRVGVFDLTRPEFGVPVTRVFVAGLEGYVTPGYYRPGRRSREVVPALEQDRSPFRMLGMTRRPGSSLRPGVAYHDLPFEEYATVPAHRNGTARRVAHIVEQLGPVDGWRGIDIGCSVGGITFGLQSAGAMMTGVDNDPAAIAAAEHVEREQRTGAVFRRLMVPSRGFDDLLADGPWDVAVWLSSFMWVADAAGFRRAVDVLRAVGSAVPRLVFETAEHRRDSDAGSACPFTGPDDVRAMLESVYATVVDTGTPVSGWGDRTVFYCTTLDTGADPPG